MARRRSHKRKAAKRRSRRRISGDQSFAPAIIGRMRKHSKKRSHRRHRVGAMSDATSTLAGVAGGVIVGIVLDKLADKFAPNVSPKIKSLAKTGIGVAMVVMKGKPLVKNLGLGLAANGVSSAAKDFGIVSGIDEFMSGIGAAGDSMLIEMNGTPENAGKMMNGEYMNGSNQVMPGIIG